VFQAQKASGVITITDKKMTRFWMTIGQGVKFVLECIERMIGGEVFIPKVPSMKVIDLAKFIGPDCEFKETGIRPGEKIHESLLSVDEVRNTLEFTDSYIIRSLFTDRKKSYLIEGKPLDPGFEYRSDTNKKWLTRRELSAMINAVS